ncbi:hypothetical protein [Aeoliella sp.]|uniref:hypothetical protein n=1 Tax=Aeoliella sp. TaxID=2795800 RepID=UPI003CCC11B0
MSTNRPNNLYRTIGAGAVLLAAFVASGCGESDGRLAVEGTVTFDGQPLPEGKISFMPLPGTSSPTAGATISQGKFQVPPEKGLKPGEFEVSINAVRGSGKKVFDEDAGGMIELEEVYIPDHYNRKTELRAIIKQGEDNQLVYNLTST